MLGIGVKKPRTGVGIASEKTSIYPKYAPVNRYSDIIGCLNNWADGWADWIWLNKQGGPNWFKIGVAVIVDVEKMKSILPLLYYGTFQQIYATWCCKIGCEINNKELW
jgi:glucosylceramidase